MATRGIATTHPKGVESDVLDNPTWWTALSLEERRRRPPVQSRTDAARARGTRRLDAWRTDKAVTGGLEPDFSRWHASGLDEDKLRLLAGESPESLRDRFPHPPPWLTSVARAWSVDLSEEVSGFDDGWPADDLGPAAGLLALVHPLSSWYQRRLHEELNRLSSSYGHDAEVPHSHPLLRPHHDAHLAMTTPVLVAQLQKARRAGALAGGTSAARFGDFVQQLREPACALRILAEFPTLTRELVDELETWLTVRRELAERVLADLPTLRAAFGVAGSSLNDIVDLRTGSGDTHRGGRSVSILTFRGGGKVVYKPRRLAAESHFYAVVDWLNAKGPAFPLRRLTLVERDAYGWAEFVRSEGCSDEDELRRFFWRHGAQVALLYLLRASDIHLENVIAAGEHPVVVDLEAIFQQVPPATRERRPLALPTEAVNRIEESVLATGLLPQRLIQQDGETVVATELSGMAGGNGDISPMKVPQWQDAGTDHMRRFRARTRIPGGQNLPTVDGAPVDPTRYAADVIAGFESCYRLLLDHRDELAAGDGLIAAFASDEIRFIALPTMVYGRILGESWHPAVLGDALDRDCLFELLATRHPHLPGSQSVAASEIRQLARRDIPFFWTRPDSRDLYDDRGVVVRDFFPRSGLDLVQDRIAGLSAADLRQQRWAVSASLAALQLGESPRAPRPRVHTMPPDDIDQALAERAAVRIGDQLLHTALGDPEHRPVWLTLAMVTDRHWSVVPTGFESYSGLPGIALFLAQLGAQTDLSRFRSAAEAIAAMLSDHVDAVLDWHETDRNMLGLGGFSELGGYVHTLARLGALWRAQPLLAQAHRLTPELVRRFEDDHHLDVVAGTAGAALAVRTLHAVAPSAETVMALRAAGDRLLATATAYDGGGGGLAWRTALAARSPLLGFSHGVSGIAYALVEIAKATGEQRFLDGAERAVRYEHSQYDAAAGNWPDLRDASPEGTFMNAWCHGAAGVGLARAAMLGDLHLPEARVDLDAAIAAVRHELVDGGEVSGTGNDCLCHGDLGLAETLLTAGRATGDGALVATARRTARVVAETVLAEEERCGVPDGLHVPGLLMGTAGIGYGLLRAARPELVPNVLLLEPPAADRADLEEASCPASR
ncbi:type 2 lantipeptide synthetase LanM family protein [Streptomyces sp. LX-29]|uniref:type 2 lanthipeptide synthetase LanM family protein n=1 Tax=Streptomyces sp. LX-29 TaxID=2900152 RepID=UPI00240E8F15|nr:type 2 lanthipeptide synthetase LanM family protein [Streptomyces sp. LX-29]WFB11306.1 type 2 lantipeptide synthetase LanM family protein [Streptomyces sp. LX-29]